MTGFWAWLSIAFGWAVLYYKYSVDMYVRVFSSLPKDMFNSRIYKEINI